MAINMLLLLMMGWAVVGGAVGQMMDRGYPEYHHHEVIELTEPAAEEFYHHRLKPHHKSGPDTLTFLGILAVVKLLIIKTKTIALAVILLIKLPILLLLMMVKLLFAVKLFKLAKLALIPLLLPLALPLLLAPLLLLPLLLPLLLLLPIPVLAQQGQQAAQQAAGRRRRQISAYLPKPKPPAFLHALKNVLESEQCIERIACQMAKHRQPSLYSSFISWTLGLMKVYVDHPRFDTYISAYNKAKNAPQSTDCFNYVCNNKALNMF